MMASSVPQRVRNWCRRSALFNTAWGFGLVLVLGLFVFAAVRGLGREGHDTSSNAMYRHWGLPQWLWSFSGAGPGLFAEMGEPDISLDEIGSYWWEAYRVFAIPYLVGIGTWSAVTVSLSRGSEERPGAPSEVLSTNGRGRKSSAGDFIVGALLIASGVAVVLSTWWSQVDYAQHLIATSIPQLEDYATRLRGELWRFSIQRAVPFWIAGSLLMLPFDRWSARA